MKHTVSKIKYQKNAALHSSGNKIMVKGALWVFFSRMHSNPMKNTNGAPAAMCYQRSVGIQGLSVLVYFEKYNI
mgnify:FL=1